MSRSLHDLTAVDWRALHGAYGPSRPRADDSTGATDVAAHLRALVSEDEDTFEDALWGGLGAHVSHQGDIYEVTSFVVPFIVGIVDDRAVPRRGDVAGFLVILGESACRYVRSDHEVHRAIGERTRRALLDDAGSLERWWRDEDERVAKAGVTLAWLLEDLRVPLVEHVNAVSCQGCRWAPVHGALAFIRSPQGRHGHTRPDLDNGNCPIRGDPSRD